MADRQRQNINKDMRMREKMSSLEKLKKDMNEKRKVWLDADAAYAAAAKRKYKAALKQAPATSSERVSISREDAKDAEVLFRASAVMAANYDNMATSTDFERSADRIKTALEAANE